MKIPNLQEFEDTCDDEFLYLSEELNQLNLPHRVHHKTELFTGILNVDNVDQIYTVSKSNKHSKDTKTKETIRMRSQYVVLDGEILFARHFKKDEITPFCEDFYLSPESSESVFRYWYLPIAEEDSDFTIFYYPDSGMKELVGGARFISGATLRRIVPPQYHHVSGLSLKWYPNHLMKQEILSFCANHIVFRTDPVKYIYYLSSNFYAFLKTKKIWAINGSLLTHAYKFVIPNVFSKEQWFDIQVTSDNKLKIQDEHYQYCLDRWIFFPHIRSEYIQNQNLLPEFIQNYYLDQEKNLDFNSLTTKDIYHLNLKRSLTNSISIYYGIIISIILNNISDLFQNKGYYKYVYSIPKILRQSNLHSNTETEIIYFNQIIEFGIISKSDSYTYFSAQENPQMFDNFIEYHLPLESPDGLRLQRYRNWLQQACLHLNLSTDLNQPSMYWPLNAPPLLSEAGNLQKTPNQFKVQGTPSFISRLIHNQLIVESNERFDTLLEELDDQGRLSKQTYLLHGEKVWSEFEPLLLYFFVSATGPEELIRIEKEWNADGHLQRLKRYEHGILTLQQSFDHSGKLLHEENSAQNPELREQLQLLWSKELLVPLPDTLEAIPIEQAENNGNYCFYKGHPYSGFVKNETEEYRARLLYNYGMLMGFEIRSQDKGAGLRGFGSEQFYFQTEWGEGEACREEVFEFGICISRKVRNEAGEILFDFKLGEEEEDFTMLNHCREWYAITKQCSYRETRPIGS